MFLFQFKIWRVPIKSKSDELYFFLFSKSCFLKKYRNCKNWVEAQFSFSQSSWFMTKILTCSRRLWHWVSFPMMQPSLIFIAVSISRNKFFIFALLWGDIFWIAPIKDAARCWGSELQRKIGPSTRFERTDRDVGPCFPNHFVVFESLNVSFWTQIGSKSEIVNFCKSFRSLMYLILKESSLSKRSFEIWCPFFG